MKVRGTRQWLLAAAIFVLGGAGLVVRQRVRPFRDVPPSPAFAVIREMGHGHGVAPIDGRFLYDEILRRRCTRGLDLGTASGYSALWAALALRRNGGTLVTVEIDEPTARAAAARFRRAGLDGVISLRVADAVEEIPKLEGSFDYVFMDVGVPLNKEFLDLLRGRIRPGGVILAHNAELFPWTQPEFLHAITTDPGLETSFYGWIFRISCTVRR